MSLTLSIVALVAAIGAQLYAQWCLNKLVRQLSDR